MSNIIDKIQLSGVTYDIGGGGGKAIVAGTGIAITTGETANTVSLDINAKKGSSNTALVFNYINSNTATAAGATSFGYMCKATNQYTFANGNNTQAKGYYSHSEGETTIANGWASHSDGQYTNANGKASHTEGSYVNAENDYESSQGRYNVSNKANTTWGNSGNTLFSVGNGTADNARHNAFEIRQNGDIYITSGGTDIKLQDHLGGGGSSYSAGTGIDITNDVISVTGKQDTLISGTNIKTVNNESILGSGNITIQGGGSPVVELTQAQYDALQTIDPDTIYVITDAQGGDLSQYMTSAQTVNAISTAVASKVDTSAITTTITSSSTNSQVPSAKAVYDIVGNIETLLSQI